MEELFDAFPKEREQGLKRLYRYSAFDVLFYRSNLWDHSKRVSWLVEELEPVARKYYKQYDAERARVLALVHDDAELFTGDIQSRVKARASKALTAKMHADERKAVLRLVAMSPKMVGKLVYKDLLMDALDRKSVESHIVTYADKLDGYCESVHEVLAGNLSLIQSTFFYSRALSHLSKKFPYLAPMAGDKSSVLTDLESFLDTDGVRASDYRPFGRPFTATSIHVPSRLFFYDAWREMVLKRGGTEGLRMLTKQREFLPK